MSTEQNKSIVRRYLEEGWGKGNVTLLRDLVSRDVVDHNPAPKQPCGLEGQESAVRAFRQGLTGIQVTVEDLVAQGDFVVDHWTASATHTGTFMDLPATGKKFSITGSDMIRFSGGKIAEIWHVEDILSMLQQLGVAPAPPQMPEQFGRPTTTAERQSGSGKTLSDDQKQDLVRRGFREMIEQANLQAANTFIAPDYRGHFSAFPPVYGIDGFKEFLSIYTTALSNQRVNIEEIVIEGDKVACRVTYQGKNTGPMLGMPATSRSINMPSLNIFRLTGDKVSEQWANNDDLKMMQQLGFVPIAAGAEAPVPC